MREQSATATRDKRFDAAQLIGSEESRLDTADDQSVIRETALLQFLENQFASSAWLPMPWR